MKRLSDAEAARPDEKWDMRWAQYEAVHNIREDGLSNVNVPLERSVIENKKAEVLARAPDWDLIPQEKSDVDQVEVMREIWDCVWYENDTMQQLNDLYDQGAIFGTGWWMEGFVSQSRVVEDADDIDDDGNYTTTTREIRTQSLFGKPLDARDVFPQPVRDHKDMDWIIWRERIPKEIFDMRYGNLDTEDDKSIIKNTDLVHEQIGIEHSTYHTDEEIRDHEPKVTLYHCFQKSADKYAIVANKTILIRDTSNPYWHHELPIQPFFEQKRPQSLWGIGICETLENTKSDINTFRNLMVDNLLQTGTNSLMVGQGINFEGVENEYGNGAVWRFDGDIGQVKPVPVNPPNSGVWNYDDILFKDSVRFTGIDINALFGSQTKTAFEARLQEQQKLKMAANTLRNLEDFLTRIGRLRLSNIKQFFPITTAKSLTMPSTKERKNRSIMVEGKIVEKKDNKVSLRDSDRSRFSFLEVSPSLVRNNLDIRVVTRSTTPVLRELQLSEIQEIVNMTAQIGKLNPEVAQEINVAKMIESAIELIGKNPDDLMRGDSAEKEREKIKRQVLDSIPMPPKIGGDIEAQEMDQVAQFTQPNQ